MKKALLLLVIAIGFVQIYSGYELTKKTKAANVLIAEIEAVAAAEAAAEAAAAEVAAAEAARMAKIEAETAKQAAIYQARLQQEQMIKDRQAQLALEREIAAFEAELEAELAAAAKQKIVDEIAAFKAQLKAELAAQEMMSEIEAEMAARELLELRQAALEAFQQKLADEKAAAAASNAAYQAKLAYDARVDKILQDLVVKLEVVIMPDDYKLILVEELIEEATAKLEEEKFIGAISGEIVTVAIHEFCKDNLNLSDSNIELFKKALAGGYLGNVGPQVTHGTEFTENRWDKYITCVGSINNEL